MASDPVTAEDIAILIPCYNVGSRVVAVAEGALRQTSKVIVVDDGCTDGCIAPLHDLPVEILSFPKNRGKGHALLAGFRFALKKPDVAGVCVVDADGQHDTNEFPRLYKAFQEQDADLVIGSRVFTDAHVPFRSRFGNQVTALVTALLLRRRLPDTQSGYRLLSRSFAQTVVDTIAGGRYETEMEIIVNAVRGGHRIVSVPIATLYEEGNRSSHFNKVGDSLRIYGRLFRAVTRRR